MKNVNWLRVDGTHVVAEVILRVNMNNNPKFPSQLRSCCLLTTNNELRVIQLKNHKSMKRFFVTLDFPCLRAYASLPAATNEIESLEVHTFN